jgi:hypothetical protein
MEVEKFRRTDRSSFVAAAKQHLEILNSRDSEETDNEKQKRLFTKIAQVSGNSEFSP